MERQDQNQNRCMREERYRLFFSLSHLCVLAGRSWKFLALVTLVMTFTAAFYGLSRPLSYSVSATLKEPHGGQSRVGFSGGSFSLEKEKPRALEMRSPAALMLSRKILVLLVEELKLHTEVRRIPTGFFDKVAGWWERKSVRMGNTWRVEWAKWMGETRAEIVEVATPLELDEAKLHGAFPVAVEVRVQPGAPLKLLDTEGRTIAVAPLGSLLESSELSLLISKQPAPGSYRVVLHPSAEIAFELAKQVTIKQSKANDSLYHLHYTGGSPSLGVKLLNGLMEHYRDYLVREAREREEKKLAYLEKRQKELLGTMEAFLVQTRPSYQPEQGGEQYLDYEKQAELLSTRREELRQKGASLSTQMTSLEKFELDGSALFAGVSERMPELKELTDRLQVLHEERDRLELESSSREEVALLTPDEIEKELREVDRMERKSGDLERLLTTLKPVKQVSPPLLADAAEVTPPGAEPMMEYLQRAHRRYQMKSKLRRHELLFQQQEAQELKGLTKEATAQLLNESQSKMEALQKELKRYGYFLTNLEKREFPIGALSGELDDRVSEELIRQAAEVQERVDNEAFYTDREIRYFTAFLERKKKALKGHLGQELESVERRYREQRQRGALLRAHLLRLTEQQRIVLEQQVADRIGQRRSALAEEMRLVVGELASVDRSLEALPEKWAAEQERKMRSELHAQMATAISEMLEAIQLSGELEEVRVEALDPAVFPAFPDRTRFLKFTLFGLIWGVMFGIGSMVIHEMIAGLRMTPQALQAFGGHLGGQVSDRDALRRALSHVSGEERKGRLLIAGAGAHCAEEVAKLLQVRGEKALLIELPTKGEQGTSEGSSLLSYLEGKTKRPEVVERDGISLLSAGGETPYVVERLDSQLFSTLLEKLSKHYDWLIFQSPAKLASIELEMAERHATHQIITMKHTPCGEAERYLEGSKPTSFLFVGG